MSGLKTTLRVLVNTKCNLSCDYCVNNKQWGQDMIHWKSGFGVLSEDNLRQYRDVVITGGEPLLQLDRVVDVIGAARSADCTIILYTNGILLNRYRIKTLVELGVDYFSIGIHQDHVAEVRRLVYDFGTDDNSWRARFHINEALKESLTRKLPKYENYKWWKLNDCERSNEDIVAPWNKAPELRGNQDRGAREGSNTQAVRS